MQREEVARCYAQHAEALTRFAATLVGPHDAHDVVSMAVIGVLASPSVVEDLRGYLYRSVLNASRKHWRTLDRRTRRERFEAEGVVEAVDPPPELRDALAQLSPQQRAVIHLTYWDDLTPSMVALRLSVGEGTVRRQLARARKKLAEVLTDER